MKTIVRGAEEGERLWFYGGGVHTWKLTAEETAGALGIFEDHLVRGKTTPLHMHPEHDELLYVVEGELLVHNEGAPRRIGPGSTIFTPRGVAHAFVVVSETARILALATPGAKAESFYRDASVPLEGPAASGPVDFARIGAAASRTGATVILGPPPFDPPRG